MVGSFPCGLAARTRLTTLGRGYRWTRVMAVAFMAADFWLPPTVGRRAITGTRVTPHPVQAAEVPVPPARDKAHGRREDEGIRRGGCHEEVSLSLSIALSPRACTATALRCADIAPGQVAAPSALPAPPDTRAASRRQQRQADRQWNP